MTTNGTTRAVLENVPRIHFYEGGARCPEDIIFPSAMRAILEYLGDKDFGCRHCLGCADAPTPVVKTTVVVRIDLDALKSGVGVAQIDGIDQPVSAATARRMAADAELIPVVLGGESVPLDLGRASRLFTRAQRLALQQRRRDHVAGPVVLPDNHRRQRLPGAAVPSEAALALVGEPERRHLAGRFHAGSDVGQELVGVVLDPAGARMMLAGLQSKCS